MIINICTVKVKCSGKHIVRINNPKKRTFNMMVYDNTHNSSSHVYHNKFFDLAKNFI